MPERFDSPIALQAKLSEILVKGALYQTFAYEGRACHLTRERGAHGPRLGLLPQRLKMFCHHNKCQKETWWETDSAEVYFLSDFIKQRFYTCKNCEQSKQYYYFVWQENEKSTTFMKVGQHPPLAIEPPPELAKALGRGDTGLYRKALINANFGHGLGAVAYFRRVLENQANFLLELIVEAAKHAQAGTDELPCAEEIKNSGKVEEKLGFAAKILPAQFRPGGNNPLDKLSAAAGAGLQGESDDQCLAIFSEGRFVFEYLLKSLLVSNEEAREYVKRVSSVAQDS
jgi:hypothetical protein